MPLQLQTVELLQQLKQRKVPYFIFYAYLVHFIEEKKEEKKEEEEADVDMGGLFGDDEY